MSRGQIKTGLAILAILLGSSAPAQTQPLTGSALTHWKQFNLTITQAKKVVVFVGTPRWSDKGAKPAEPIIEIEDFEFYRDARELKPELAARLTKLVSDLRSFSDYGGMKMCGGFHPDLCIEWQFEQNGQRWHKRAFGCLGCHEWRLVDTGSAVHTDMTNEAADELKRVLRELGVDSKKS